MKVLAMPLDTIPRLLSLKKRSEFVKLSKSDLFFVSPHFIVQAAPKKMDHPRFGVTASKKVGNAVARNRAKRRLRVLGQLIGQWLHPSPFDYTLIARKSVIEAPFQDLLVHAQKTSLRLKDSAP